MSFEDDERNRFSARATRYARVGVNVGGVAARIAGSFIAGRSSDADTRNAAALTQALGGLKGPLMKVAQLMATIPELLPAEYAAELQALQSEAPPMGWAFVKRRMAAELGPEWDKRFLSFEKEPAAAASLGQVHRARAPDGQALACKLQYPDMSSAVEADLSQLDVLFSIHRRMGAVIDTREIKKEIAERIREELDYTREAGHARLYQHMLAGNALVRVPAVRAELSTRRLLCLHWLDGEKLLSFKNAPIEERNQIARAMFAAWWQPFSTYGVIHGDPHLGNYTVFRNENGTAVGINLLDYGCIRVFPPQFVGGVVDLYHGLRTKDDARIVHAYETWGFKNLSKELIGILNIWAGFIYGPLLDDRVRTMADGVKPGDYGRKEAFKVHQALKAAGPVTIPREFVFMDRAAIGLGAVFLHLSAELNYYQLLNDAIDEFSVERVTRQQDNSLRLAGLRA